MASGSPSTASQGDSGLDAALQHIERQSRKERLQGLMSESGGRSEKALRDQGTVV